MSESAQQQEIYFVGVDGGGTKCRAVITDYDLNILGLGCGGPANPYQDIGLAKQSINHAIHEAILAAGLSESSIASFVVAMGLAGTNIAGVCEAVCQWQMPFKDFYVTTDLEVAAIAAHESVDGAVIVIGTGSCGYSHKNGKSIHLGGHGFPLGDKGSGAWLGLSAVQRVLLAEDGLGPQTLLNEILGAHFKASGLKLVERLGCATQSEFGAIGPMVFDALTAGDEVALGLVKEGADYLSALAKKLLVLDPPRLSAIGSLAPRMMPYMDCAVTNIIQPVLNPPEIGAAFLAKQRYSCTC